MLRSIWFGRWAESVPGVLSSSGWEHANVGERTVDNRIVGFHSWVYFYNEEDHRDANYLGYINVTRAANVTILSAPVQLYGSYKAYTEFVIGASPELELALGTLCFLARADDACKLETSDNVAYTYDVHTLQYEGVQYIESAHATYQI